MKPLNHYPSSARGSITLVVLGALALACVVTSAIAWVMHLNAQSSAVPAFSKPVSSVPAPQVQAPGSREALTQLFGAPTNASAVAKGGAPLDGMQLQGIVVDRRGTGVALISIDGAAAIRVRAGAQVREGVRLAEIQQRHVVLDRGGKTVELALAKRVPLPSAALDTRQRMIPGAAPVTPPAPPPPPAPPSAPTPAVSAAPPPGAAPTQ